VDQDRIELTVVFRNGENSIEDVTVTLSSPEPGMVITDETRQCGTINGGDETRLKFVIDVSGVDKTTYELALGVSHTVDGSTISEEIQVPLDLTATLAHGETDAILGELDTILGAHEGAVNTMVDLHVHTPASECCTYDGPPGTFVDMIWDRCRRTGVRLLALADHNSPGYSVPGDVHSRTYYELFRERLELEKARGGYELEVLPGTELTANGIHILAIFPPHPYAAFTIASLLDELGVRPEEWGGRDTVCTESATRVLDEVTRRGGIAIPAHVDSGNGLLEKHPSGQELIRVIKHEALHGVEFVNASPPAAIVSKVARHRPDRPLAYLRGSDFHLAKAGDKDKGRPIGERYSWVKMGTRSFTGLKKAIQDPIGALRTSTDSISKGGFTRLLGMTVHKGFADGTCLKFNSDMNCFIGRMGSGKSTRLKLIARTLDPKFDYELRDEVVHLVFDKANVESSRHYYLFQAGSGSGQRFFRIGKGPRTVEEVNDADEFGLALPLLYDQSEIDKIVGSPAKLLDFISRHYFKLPKTLMDTGFVERMCEGLTRGGRLTRETQLRKLQEALSMYAAHRDITLADKKLDSEIRKELKRLMDNGLMEDHVVHPPDDLANIARLASQIGRMEKDERRVRDAVDRYVRYRHQRKNAEMGEFEATVDGEPDPRKVSRAMKDLLDQGDLKSRAIRNDLEQYAGTDDHDKLLKDFLDDDKLEAIRRTRREYLVERTRVILAGAYTQALEDRNNIRQRFVPEAGSSPDVTVDGEALKDAYQRVYDLRTVLAELFRENFVDEDGEYILTLKVRRGGWKENLEGAGDREAIHRVVNLEMDANDDVPELRLRGDEGLQELTEEFKDLKTLSTMLLILNNREFGPFIVDEPEQHLDSESVFRHLVPRLRHLKDDQQLIMVTRDANIPLAGDAENIIITHAEDKHQSHVTANGSLDLESINTNGVAILEGGYDAFSSRRRKYSLFGLGSK